jgi:hypothetical protein
MLDIKSADELADPELEARWALRRAARQKDVLRTVLRAFVEHGGPIAVDQVAAAFPGRAPEAVRDSLAELDAADLIEVRDGRVATAYPFSTAPTPFLVRLAGGRQRQACCAIDALGLAPMLGQPVDVRSRCHHCGTPLEFSVTPEGPGPEARDVMVWVGKRRETEGRIATSL